MTVRRRWRFLVATAVGAAAGTAGCSDSTGSADPADEDNGAHDYSVSAMLAEVPAAGAGDSVLIQTADLGAATEAAGLMYPTSGRREDVSPWLVALTVGEVDGEPTPVFVPMASSFNLDTAAPDEFADVAGWSVLDVDAFVEQTTPPTTFAVVTGDFAGDSLADDLVETDDGIVSDKDGEDFEVDLDQITALSRIGQPVRMAQDGDKIALSSSTPEVRAWLDDEPSLAEDEAFAAVAGALDGQDVMSAALSRPISGGPAAEAIPGEPFDAVGIGWSVEDDAPLVHAAYHFDSDDAAADAVDALETGYRDGASVMTGQPFSERFTVESAEATGPVVLITVTPTDEGRVPDLYQALIVRDSIFISP